MPQIIEVDQNLSSPLCLLADAFPEAFGRPRVRFCFGRAYRKQAKFSFFGCVDSDYTAIRGLNVFQMAPNLVDLHYFPDNYPAALFLSRDGLRFTIA